MVQVKRPGQRRSQSRSATRALDVLEAFGAARRPLRAIEIARMLDLTPSSANQLLKTMAESAHLLFDARTKAYQPSPRLAALASWISETCGFDSRISDLIRDVQARTGFVTTVSMPSDLFMQVIDLSSTRDTGGERGLKISLFGSAIGSAFLSSVDEAEVRRLAKRARVPDTELPAMFDCLADIRETGHAAGPTTGREMWSIAVSLPMFVLNGRAVLGIAGPTELLSERSEAYAGGLHDAVAQLFNGEQAARETPA